MYDYQIKPIGVSGDVAMLAAKKFMNGERLNTWEFIRVWVSKSGCLIVQKFWEDNCTIEDGRMENMGKIEHFLTPTQGEKQTN